MPAQITNYQCPACTGPLHFVGESGKLECDYCGSSYEAAEIQALYAEKEEKAAAAQQAAEEAKKGTMAHLPLMEEYGIPLVSARTGERRGRGCGLTAAPAAARSLSAMKPRQPQSCPYCGNPAVVPGQFSGVLRPDFIIPFKSSKEDAIKALKKHYQGKFFLPKCFTQENHVQEIRGIYVPLLDVRRRGGGRRPL